MIQDLRRRIIENDLVHGQGTTRHADVRDAYITASRRM
jgi:phosphomannomutase/phosphoglucomutase